LLADLPGYSSGDRSQQELQLKKEEGVLSKSEFREAPQLVGMKAQCTPVARLKLALCLGMPQVVEESEYPQSNSWEVSAAMEGSQSMDVCMLQACHTSAFNMPAHATTPGLTRVAQLARARLEAYCLSCFP
jgi:hypothetical protein